MTMKGSKFYNSPSEFQDHMRTKIEFWNPKQLHIGQDFAVFTFDLKYQHDNAYNGVLHWADAYQYTMSSDGDRRLVIRNVAKKE